jgi:predicted RNA-binding Zn-ribbon protein involved in translation (DUF1610 family)
MAKVRLRPDLVDHMVSIGIPVSAIQKDIIDANIKLVGVVTGFQLSAHDGQELVQVEFPGHPRPFQLFASYLVQVETPKKVFHHNCPKCGDEGEWRMCALVCRRGHGIFAG